MTLQQSFFEQVREAARLSRENSKRQLLGKLLEAHEKLARYEAALHEIIASEEEQAIRSYGLGDIARKALTNDP